MKKLLSYCLGLVFFLPVAANAQKSCTEMGCVDGLILQVDPAFNWKAGNFNFDFVLDNRHVRCYGELPLKPCGEQSLTCNKPGVMITESGCALPEAAQGFGDIHIEGDPAKVMVRITHNNRPVVTRTIITEYNKVQPNGPGCGPICRSATYQLFSAE